MKYLVIDSGSIISLSLNNLLWTMEEMKKKSNIQFIVPHSVKGEIIDKPLKSKKYKLEAIQIKKLFSNGTITEKHSSNIKEYLNIVNNIYYANKEPLTIIQEAELEALVLTKESKADGLIVDERTIRLLVESPERLKKILERKLETEIEINKNNLKRFKNEICCVPIIRSTELMYIAYEKGIFKELIKEVNKKEFLDGLLWGLKLRGCSISSEEIKKLVSLS